jgi:hypothetical protein
MIPSKRTRILSHFVVCGLFNDFPFHEDLRNAYSSLYLKVGCMNLWHESKSVPWSKVLLEKLIVALLAPKFLDFCGTWRFSTMKRTILWDVTQCIPEEGGLVPNYTALKPRRSYNSSSHSLPCSPFTSVLNKINPLFNPEKHLFHIRVDIILPSTRRARKSSFALKFCQQKFCMTFLNVCYLLYEMFALTLWARIIEWE